jgi:hypothetical protein
VIPGKDGFGRPFSFRSRPGTISGGAAQSRVEDLPSDTLLFLLGGRWLVSDPRNNAPRIGRVLIAQGRDAADVTLTQHVRIERPGGLPGMDGHARPDLPIHAGLTGACVAVPRPAGWERNRRQR